MDHDTKAAIETLTKTVQDGFASVEKRFASLDERMEQGFAAVAEDLADTIPKPCTAKTSRSPSACRTSKREPLARRAIPSTYRSGSARHRCLIR
jgi:hypothetical protein